MAQTLKIHVTCCSQLAVHYFDFQFKVTLYVQNDNNYKAEYKAEHNETQWDTAMCYAPGVQLEGMMKTTRNLNHYNQLLDYHLKKRCSKI